MASKVEIINMALRGLGADSIASLTENSENARKMSTAYPIILKGLLRLHPWSFNKKETALSRLSDVPVLEDFLYIYSLPADFVRLNKTSVEPAYAHKIKGRNLYSNADAVSIEYGYYLDDPTQYDDAFVETLAAKLAAELCYAITRDKDMVKVKWAEFKEKVGMTRSLNGMETTPDEAQEDTWLNSRI